MSVVADELYSLLVPLGRDRLVVPRSCVAEVIRYMAPAAEEPGDSWYRGKTKWNNRSIPVISFERMCDIEPPPASGRTRVVVFHPLGGVADCPPYGLLSEGFPQMVKVNREVVVLDETYTPSPDVPLICRINMLKEFAMVPDLEMIEQKLAAELSATIA